MIACSRQVIVEENAHPDVTALRGLDRELADAFTRAGYHVDVRACMFASPESSAGRIPGDVYTIMTLKRPMTKKGIAGLDDFLTFAETATSDEGDFDDMEGISLAKYIDDQADMDHWVMRKRAHATLIHEAEMFSDDGYFGNEAYGAFLYTLASMEILPALRKGPPVRVGAEEEEEDEDEDDDEEEDEDEDED